MIWIRGQTVTLRPIRADEIDVFATLYDQSGAAVLRPSRAKLRRRIEQSGVLRRGRLDLGIEAGGRLVGDVDARSPANAFPPGVFEIGIVIFDPADRGKGWGVEATRLIVDHLFDVEEAERVQASTDQENASMRAVLERVGFRHEGILRGFFPSADGRADYAMYAITRADWLDAARDAESV